MPSLYDLALDDLLSVTPGYTEMTFSASKIQNWMNCNRRAGWEVICGYRPVETGAKNKGVAVHAVLEEFRRSGTLVDRMTEEGEIASEALPYLPEHHPEETLEQKFSLKGRHEWIGYKDVEQPGLVLDYKTTSDLKWAMSEVDLWYNVQAVLYAHDHLVKHPALGEVVLSWLYMKTRAPFDGMTVNTVMWREHAAAGFEALEAYADQMHAAVCAAPTDVVEKHKYVLTLAAQGLENGACDAYGREGCPHKARCNVSFFREKKEFKPMTLEEMMKEMQSTPAPAQTQLAAPAPPIDLLAKLAEPSNPPPGPFAEMAANAPPAGTYEARPTLGPSQAEADQTVVEAAAINPPKRPRGRPKKDTIPAPAPTGDKGAELAALLQAPADETLSPLARQTIEAGAQRILNPAPVRLIETLCVGCLPVGQPFESFDTLWAQARDMIGMASYFQNYGYKTNGMMLEAITRILTAKPVDTLVIPNPNTQEATLCLSFLRSSAATVVESIR